MTRITTTTHENFYITPLHLEMATSTRQECWCGWGGGWGVGFEHHFTSNRDIEFPVVNTTERIHTHTFQPE